MLRGVQKKAEGLLQFCTDAPPSARLLTTENDPHIIQTFIHVHVLTGKYFVSFLLLPKLNSDFFFLPTKIWVGARQNGCARFHYLLICRAKNEVKSQFSNIGLILTTPNVTLPKHSGLKC